MPTVSNAARITSKDGTVWRTCGGCGTLAALPPDIDRCTTCQPGSDAPVVQLRPEHFGTGDLFDISMGRLCVRRRDRGHRAPRDQRPRLVGLLRNPAGRVGPATPRAGPDDRHDQRDPHATRRRRAARPPRGGP